SAGVDVQVGITFLVFLIAFGALSLAVQRWAPKASPLLLPLVVAITGLGFMTVYSLDVRKAGLQRWWVLIGAAAAGILLWLLSSRGTSVVRRYRNLILLVSVLLLLLPNLPTGWGFPLRGLEQGGSRLWVTLKLGGSFSVGFQPAELAKLGLVAFFAAYLADHQRALREVHRKVGPFSFPE